MLPGIYLKRKIHLTKGNIKTVGKIYAENCNRKILEKMEIKYRGKWTEKERKTRSF
jgi:hypothetical protein